MSLRCSNVYFLLFLLWHFVGGRAAPTIIQAGLTDPEEVPGMVEGDMVLTADQQQLLQRPLQMRNGLINTERRWPNRVVYYNIIGQDFAPEHFAAIEQGIKTLESRTCLKFQVAGDSQAHYVAIGSNKGGCYTAVGYQAKVQEMNLEPYPIGEGCFRPGTILHEFMHALGFYHEQSSAMRDDYIKVMYENMIPGKEYNFKKYSPTVVTDFDAGYDYDSCLHYRPGAFSINGQDTIVPLDPAAKIGQRLGMSDKDVDKINVMYKCPIEI